MDRKRNVAAPIASMVSSVGTALVATSLFQPYIDVLKAVDLHEGVSFMWRVYSLVGVGLLIGTCVNIGLYAIMQIGCFVQSHKK